MMRLRMKQGDSPEHAAQRLLQILERKGPRGLAMGIGEPRHRSIEGVLQGSLELLSPEDRTRLMELSIFPEDIPIPLSAAAAVWQADELEAEETALRFAGLSLFKLDLGRGAIRMHDVMRKSLANPKAVEIHSRLVDAWPNWMQLPDSSAWRWLIWHLAQAGRKADIERILYDPAWLQAKLRATDVNALIGDFEHLMPALEAELIQGALRFSSDILAKYPSQFASQMVGRLLPYEGQAAIKQFTASVAQGAGRPWLRPLRSALDPPRTALACPPTGHSSWVNAVAVNSHGRRAVSASGDGTLKVWHLETGDELRTLIGHSNSVTAVALTPDGLRAVSASGDGTLKVWHLETGDELRTLMGHSNSVTAVALSPDGLRAVSASGDGTLKVWHLETGDELHTLAGHSGWVSAVAVTSDGLRAVSTSRDRTLKVWDLETGSQLRTLAGHTDGVISVTLTPDGLRAISGSLDKTLKVWDLETGDELRTLVGHDSWVRAVAVTPDGQRAVSASRDRTLKVWDLETGGQLRTLGGHTEEVTSVAVTSDGLRAVSASFDHTLKAWDLKIGGAVATFVCDASVNCFALRNYQTIVAGDRAGRVHHLSLELPQQA